MAFSKLKLVRKTKGRYSEEIRLGSVFVFVTAKSAFWEEVVADPEVLIKSTFGHGRAGGGGGGMMTGNQCKEIIPLAGIETKDYLLKE